MTHVIKVKNVNYALTEGFWWLKTAGLKEASRNGPVVVAPGPVITEYLRPDERVLFNPDRDANPVFHLMEAIWMLAGENDVKWLSQFSSNIGTYAEDDGTVHGAYGHRWRRHFGLDQVKLIIAMLAKDPDSRQAVMQMWDAVYDVYGAWKDRPCNTQIYFDTRKNSGGTRKLNMTVCCRSNDALWGAYGANAVHFSVLQEVIASALGVQMGVYRQMSNNFHAYEKTAAKFLESPPGVYDEYGVDARSLPMLGALESLDVFLEDCVILSRGSDISMETRFMREVAKPLCVAYLSRKAGEEHDITDVPVCDWKLAFEQWCARRRHAKS